MRLIGLILVCSIIIPFGCHPDGPHGYLAFFNDPQNGLINTIESDNWEYTVQYRSAEYMALIELGQDGFDKLIFPEVKSSYDDFDYYLFKMKHKNNARLNQILSQEDLEQYATGWNNGITLVDRADTINPKMMHFENLLSLLGEVRFLTAFDKQDKIDKEFFIASFDTDTKISLSLQDKHLSKIPELNL